MHDICPRDNFPQNITTADMYHGQLGSRVVSMLDSGAVGRKVMAAYRRVYDSRHLQVDCQEPGSAPEPYAQ